MRARRGASGAHQGHRDDRRGDRRRPVGYVVTRPLGAPAGDWLSQPTADGGPGLGTTGTGHVFLAVILTLVVYLTVTRRDVSERPQAVALETA